MATTSRPGERGAALLVVLVAVAVLTALAADLAYDTRVSLRIAANARDDLRATYLAKSGVALSRLVLSFQQELDGAIPRIPGQPSLPRPQIWRLVPVTSGLAAALFDGVPREEGAERVAAAPGAFEASVDDEGRKVNVQFDAGGTGALAAQVQALFQLVCDPRWDALFDRDDASGVRASRQDLLVHLRDWVDEDEVSSALVAGFPGGSCAMITPPNPFERGFGDENHPYDRGEDRYRAKNARMDSLAELHLVAGVSDLFMAAFGDALTVYLPRDAKWNVNETDPALLLVRAMIAADPPIQPAFLDPELPARLHGLVLERTFGGILSLSSSDFGQLVQLAGVTVNMSPLAENSPQNPFTDRSFVFRIRAVGQAGDVRKKLEAVVRFEQTTQGQPGSTSGRLVHWREE
jgi:general secretion pathway protein K